MKTPYIKIESNNHFLHFFTSTVVFSNDMNIRMVYIRTIFVFLFIFLLCSGASSQQQTIRVGVFTMEPISFMDESGNAKGLYPDLVREVFKNKKTDLSFVPCHWAECLDKLNSEDIDLMGPMAYNSERSRVMDYSHEPVAEIWGQVFSTPSHRITSMKSLENKTVALMKKDINGENFIKTSKSLGVSCRILEVKSHYDVFQAVRQGEAVAGIAPQHFGLRQGNNYGLVATFILFSPFPTFFSVKKGLHKHLLEAIDQNLSQWKKDKDSFYYDRLNYWMGGEKYERRIIPIWLIGLVIIVLCIASLQLLLNRYLIRKIKARTQKLNSKEKEYRELVEGTNTIIFRWDREGMVSFMNTYGLNLFGFTKEELLGRSIFETIVPETSSDGINLAQMIRDIVKNPENYIFNENENQCKDGRRVYIQWSNRPIMDEDGNFLEMLSIGTDITEQKRLEADLFQARKMEAIGTLAGGVAHDFNNILSIILGYAELIQLNPDQPEDIDIYTSQILQATFRAKDLVAQILAFSRKTDASKQLIQPSVIVKEVLKMIRSTLPSTIDIRQNIQSDSVVWADPSQMHQVIMNLCTNAYHAMEESGGTLSISLKDITIGDDESFFNEKDIGPGHYIEIEVSDTGAGIEEGIIRKIFEPYFTTKKQGKGTGLGLSVVHGVIKEHKGHINVQSVPGRGSTFQIYLPVAERGDELIEKKKDDGPVKGCGERILLIDDEPDLMDATRIILSDFGYSVTGFYDARDALALFTDNPHRFDLLITDMTMPGITGSQLAGEVLSLRPGFPIILCTGFSERITREEAVDLGISEFLQKPVTVHTLLRKVRELLDQRARHI